MRPTYSTPPDAECLGQLARQQCSKQWQTFFEAMAAEFASALSPTDLRALMHRVGMRFAAANPLPPCSTLQELQAAMTDAWERIDWGWVRLSQDAAHLDIHHSLAPISAAFGVDHAEWSGGFLEGVYQVWFEQADAGALQVRQVAPADIWGCVHLQLAG